MRKKNNSNIQQMTVCAFIHLNAYKERILKKKTINYFKSQRTIINKKFKIFYKVETKLYVLFFIIIQILDGRKIILNYININYRK